MNPQSNEIMLKRLVGLIVILVAVFLLIWLVPHRGSAPEIGRAIPVTAVPVGVTASGGVAAAPAAPGSAETVTAESSAVGSGVRTQPYRLGEASPDAAVPGAASSAAHETASRRPGTAAERSAVPASADRAAVATAQPVTSPAPSSAAGYYVQTGSYGDAGNADKALDKLRAKGYRGDVREARVSGRTWHRVRVGPYASKADAEAARRALAAAGYRGARVVRND